MLLDEIAVGTSELANHWAGYVEAYDKYEELLNNRTIRKRSKLVVITSLIAEAFF